MKKVSSLIVLFVMIASSLFGQAGLIDNSYGNGGKVTTAVGPHSSEIWGMAMQDDWSVVVGGFMYNGSDSDFAIMRYLPNGTLDNSFGNNGVVTTDMGNGSDVCYSVALQPDGKIVAGGIAWNGTNYDFAVVRYNTNGSLDNSFGNNGIVTTAIGPGNDKGVSLKMYGWSVVVGGIANNGTNNDFALVKYQPNGSLDSSFGTNGTVMTPIGSGNDMAFSIAIQQNGKIVVGGVSHNGTDYDFAVARYHADGDLDSDFGNNGKTVTDVSGKKDFVWSVLLTQDEKILLGGYSTNLLNNTDITLVQYTDDGHVDPSFGLMGKAITPISLGNEDIYSMVLQPDGKIIAGGTADTLGFENFALARYNSNGTLDPTFGIGGQVKTIMSEGENEIYAVALQPDGKVVAAGFSSDSTKYYCAMARYLTDLSLGVIDFKASDKSMFVYPNPIAADAVLKYTLTRDEKVSIRLVDLQGKTIKTFLENQGQSAGNYQQPILLPIGLPAGAYQLVVSSPDGNMSIQIVK